MQRNSGRLLLTVADLVTIVVPVLADWNESHIQNERWPSHARFHAVVGLSMAATLSAFAIWRLWAPSEDVRTGRAVAAAVPITYWAPFFPATLVPGVGVDDPPHPVARIGGAPLNLVGAAATTLTALAGWVIDRRLRPA